MSQRVQPRLQDLSGRIEHNRSYGSIPRGTLKLAKHNRQKASSSSTLGELSAVWSSSMWALPTVPSRSSSSQMTANPLTAGCWRNTFSTLAG